MATKYYGIKDNWTDDDVANVIEVASEDGSVSSVKVNGVEYGGGGGGDLPLYELKITGTVTGGDGYYIFLSSPMTLDRSTEFLGAAISPSENEGMTTNGVGFFTGTTTKSFYIPTTYTYPIAIAGSNVFVDRGSYTLSGGASFKEYEDDPGVYYIEITGDFTITGPGTNE